MKRFLVLLLLGLAACTAKEASRVAAEPTPDRTPAPVATGRHDEDTIWYLRSISPDGKTIAIVYTMSGVASGCERKGISFARESAGVVDVHAVKSVIDDKNQPCTEELGYIDETVTLDAPLGDRALVGCRPPKVDASENTVCRDLQRGRDYGIPPSPFPAEPSAAPAMPGY